MAETEIVLPQTKPETEWILGRAVQKVSPTYDHALLQRRIVTALGAWADAACTGRVGTEWRFRVAPPGEVARPLVPDVAFISFETLGRNVTRAELQVPLAAPTVAVEILSPEDRPRYLAAKIEVYLAAGAAAVIVVDPALASVRVHDLDGVQTLGLNDHLTHPALPEFNLDLASLFENMT